ncbi:hypothetical protein HOY82DRAFT_182435 [Tuber indicum]|nr:hypothetical protein HOY82DRAFT_182435 [Tuber indicum]
MCALCVCARTCCGLFHLSLFLSSPPLSSRPYPTRSPTAFPSPTLPAVIASLLSPNKQAFYLLLLIDTLSCKSLSPHIVICFICADGKLLADVLLTSWSHASLIRPSPSS